jgi:protein-tyrosine phosphatase
MGRLYIQCVALLGFDGRLYLCNLLAAVRTTDASVPPLKVFGKMKRVLFLCSGNYYRSRFAEIYFNYHAQLRGIGWRAESRGLNPDSRNAGPLSRHSASALAAHGISWAEYLRAPLRATEADFAASDRIIAVKEAEHRPMMDAYFPSWANRIEYWHVHDIDCATPATALPHLERELLGLLATLQAKAA